MNHYPLIDSRYEPEAVILADGDYPTHATPLDVLRRAHYLCCCDGAARQLAARGLQPDAIVGDGDSIGEELRRRFADRLHIVGEQQDNDLTKATRHCMAQGYRSMAYLGATGKREDHTLGNISLMARYASEMQLDVAMLTDHGYFVPIEGSALLETFCGQQVSIFNLSCTRIEAEGLKWDTYAYQQWWQGTLNEATGQSVMLRGDGNLMVFRTYNCK